MFSLIVRVISVCIIVGFFITLIFSSFFSQKNTSELLNIHDILFQKSEQKFVSGSGVYQREISSFESFFSSQKDTSFVSASGSLILDISATGSYFSSFRDLEKNYVFLGNGFRVEQKGIGEIFFDSRSVAGKVLIFPLNTSLEISLESMTGNPKEIYTHIFLTPHMYLEFDPSRGTFLKNADSLRVETLSTLGYFGKPISQIYEDVFFQAYKNVLDSFFQKSYTFISTRDTQLQNNLLFLQQQKIITISEIKNIEKYASVFINPEKKKVFYKNTIIEGFLNTLQSGKYDIAKVERIKKDIEVLRLFDKGAYDEIRKIQEYILMSLYASSNMKDIPIAFSFASFSSFKLQKETEYFSLASRSLFSLYDMKNTFSEESNTIFLESFNTFMNRDDTLQERKSLRYEYFLYFLRYQLFTLIEEKNIVEKLTSITDILKNYIDISGFTQKSSPTFRSTSLYIYDEILKNIDIYLRTQYFLPERNAQNLLQLGTKRFNTKQGTLLRIQVDRIFALYYEFSKFLDEKDERNIAISKDIEASKLRITEYFIALENYQAYASQYDISKKNLLTLDPSLGQDETLLSEAVVRRYLQTFEGIGDITSANIQVYEEYYRIENIFISGKVFRFDLYPYSSYYALKNIEIDGKILRYAYKIPLEENIDTGNGSEIINTQGNFFLSTFFSSTTTEVEEYREKDQQTVEDKTEIVFKREILLGKNGEFSKIIKTFPIKYENIRLTKSEKGYDTFLDQISFPLPGVETSYTSLFRSEYMLSAIDHYFKDISLVILRPDDGGVIFSGTPVEILGKVNIVDFENTLKQVGVQLSSAEEIYSILEKKYSSGTPQVGENLTIQYTNYNTTMTFKFEFQEKKYIISLSGTKVQKIYIDAKNILPIPTEIKNISSYIR